MNIDSTCYSEIDTSLASVHAEDLARLSSVPGLQRESAMSELHRRGVEFAYSVSFGGAITRIRADGSIMPEPYRKGETPVSEHADEVVLGLTETRLTPEEAAQVTGVAPYLVAAGYAGAAPLNKYGPGNMHIPAGVIAIVSSGGVGKSPLAHHLAAHDSKTYGVVRAGEPLLGYSSNRRDISRGIAMAIYKHTDVVIDSIKDLLSSSGGGSMKGGISRNALLDISAWASVASAMGTSLYVPINPSGDGELLEMMVEVAKSNSTMAVYNLDGQSTWQWSSRTGEGMPRLSGSYEFRDTTKDVVRKTANNASSSVSMRADPTDTANLRSILARTQSKV